MAILLVDVLTHTVKNREDPLVKNSIWHIWHRQNENETKKKIPTFPLDAYYIATPGT